MQPTAPISRLRGALWGMYIGDSISMPVHWYYDRRKIFTDFGRDGITRYREPTKSFPGSIMNLSNTGGGGRGSDKDSIIGDVILHGKKKYWLRGESYHYHHGMKAGDNTLDTLIARILLNSIEGVKGLHSTTTEGAKGTILRNPKSLVNGFLDKYIAFMTTPNSHNDVYAATAHRMFFANHVNGKDKWECADNDGHNTDSIDGLINVIPISVALVASSTEPRQLQAGNCTKTTSTVGTAYGTPTERDSVIGQERKLITEVITAVRQSTVLPMYGHMFHELLSQVLTASDDQRDGGQVLREAILDLVEGPYKPHLQRYVTSKTLKEFRQTEYLAGDPMSACYVASNFPVLLLLAYKYADNPRLAVLAGANAGGENVNRNALLGALLGAAHGMSGWDESLVSGLVKHDDYEREINRFVGLSAEGR